MTYVPVDLGYVSNKDLQLMKKNAHAITTGFLGLNSQDIFAVVYDALDRTVNYKRFNSRDSTQADLAAVPYKNLMATLLMESAHDLGVSDIRDAPYLMSNVLSLLNLNVYEKFSEK